MAKVLKDQFYIGLLPYKGQIYPGKHQKIVDEAIFNRCQGVIEEHNHFAVRSRKHNYLLRGMLFCADCGGRFYAEQHTKRKGLIFDYYYCGKCRHPYTEISIIEKQVEDAFKLLKISDGLRAKLVTKAREKANSVTENDNEKKTFQARILKLEFKRKSIEDNLLDGTIDKETYKRQHFDVEGEIVQVNQQIAKLTKDRSANIKIFEQLLFMSKDIYQTYREATPELKRRYLAIFWKRFEVRDGVIEKAVPTKVYQTLLSRVSLNTNSKVRKSKLWLPELDSNQQHLR